MIMMKDLETVNLRNCHEIAHSDVLNWKSWSLKESEGIQLKCNKCVNK